MLVKTEILPFRITTLIKDLADERQMSKALQSNQTSWQSKYTQMETNYRKFQIEKEGEITELKDQIRDLMFYMEAQNTIAKSDLKDEIATSSISLPSPSNDVNPKQRRKKKWFWFYWFVCKWQRYYSAAVMTFLSWINFVFFFVFASINFAAFLYVEQNKWKTC